MIGWLPARERWRWLGLVPIAGVAALIEAAGALAVFGLLRLVVDPDHVRSAPVVSRLWAIWPNGDPRALVAFLALGVGVFYLLRAAFLTWTAEPTLIKRKQTGWAVLGFLLFATILAWLAKKQVWAPVKPHRRKEG